MYEIALNRSDTSWGNEKLVELLAKYPAAPLAAEATFQIGKFHFTKRHFDEAIITLKALIGNYPESERVEAGIFLIGDSELGLYEGQDYESMPLLRAKTYYELLIRTYPSGAYAAKAKKRLSQITNELAKRDYRMALYYRRHGKPASSEVYLKSILKEYPETEYARRAQKLLAAAKESEK
jgi:outer membrane assembly lipoprotein YfiO